MIHRSICEWDHLPVASGSVVAVTRTQADRLLTVAARASTRLKLGGPTGERVLADGRHSLRAGQVVGVIATPDVTLEILPKIDSLNDVGRRENLIRMLARTIDLPIADGRLTKLSLQCYDLLEILIRLFCDRLFEEVHRGLPRRYVSEEDDLPALRGRLDVIRQFTTLAVAPQKLACRYEELSPDIALNQIMKAAVTYLRNLSRAAENQRRLAELGFAFSEVSTVPRDRLPWGHVVIDRTNRTWLDLVKMAELLLGKRFQTTISGLAGGFSLLFEMNTLFEEFVGRTLRASLRQHGQFATLQGPFAHALFDNMGIGRFRTVPDIVVSDHRQRRLIIDTKWKLLEGDINSRNNGVLQSDVYQMIAYAQVYGCDSLMLLYPHHRGLAPSAGSIAQYGVSGSDQTRLTVATVDLTDISSVSDQLVKLVRNHSTAEA